MREVVVGIIGCGTVAESIHLPALKMISEIEIGALADIDERRASHLLEKFHLEDASVHRDYRDLLKNPEIEAVWVLTPPRFHAEISLEALKNGKHVLVEKPLATSLEEAEVIRETLRKHGAGGCGDRPKGPVLMPAHNFAFTPCFERALDLLEGDALGDIKEIRGRTVSNLAFYKARTDFRLQAKGGVIEDQMPHILYLARRVGGPFRRVLSLEPYGEGRPLIEDARVSAELGDGVKADLSAAWSGFIPTFKLTVVGDEGRLEMDLLRRPYNLTVFRGDEREEIKLGRGFLQYLDVLRGRHPSYLREDLHFVEVVRGEAEQRITVDEGVEVVRVLDEIMEVLESRPKPSVGMERVALVRVEDGDVKRAIRESIALLGGLNFKSGSHVIVKPNICFWKNTENMVITDPRILRGVLEILDERTDQITVVESDNNSGPAEKRAEKTGVLEVVEECGAEFLNLSHDEYVEHEVAGFKIRLPKTVLDADYLVNLPKMKTCNVANTLITVAMKNMFGVIADKKKVRLHKRLVDVLLYVNRTIRQDLIIVDGVTAMEGLGPIWGTPVQLNLIVAGRNPATVDTLCCHIMGINPYSVEVLWRAYKSGMSEINIERIEVLGEKVRDVKRRFSYPIFLKKNITGAIRTALKTYL